MSLSARALLISLALAGQLYAQAAAADPIPTVAEIAALHQAAVRAQNSGNYKEAERLHRAVVEAIERVPDFPANERARQLSNLASALNLLGRPGEALEILKSAQGLLARMPSRDPAQYSTLHFNLGKSHALQGALALAEREYNEGREVLKRSGVADRLYLFESDAGLAYVYWKSGRLSDAKASYESALQFARTIIPPDHPIIKRWEEEYEAVLKALRR